MISIHNFSKLLYDLLIKLRMDDYFDTNLYNQIVMELKKNIPIWKENKSVPCEYVIYIMDLLSQLDGTNRFLDEKTSIAVYDANLEIMDLLYDLIKE